MLGRSEQEFSLERTITDKLMIRKQCQFQAFPVRAYRKETGKELQQFLKNLHLSVDGMNHRQIQ